MPLPTAHNRRQTLRRRLQCVSKSKAVTKRLLLMNAIDLKKNSWVPRRAENKTAAEVQEETKMKEDQETTSCVCMYECVCV